MAFYIFDKVFNIKTLLLQSPYFIMSNEEMFLCKQRLLMGVKIMFFPRNSEANINKILQSRNVKLFHSSLLASRSIFSLST